MPFRMKKKWKKCNALSNKKTKSFWNVLPGIVIWAKKAMKYACKVLESADLRSSSMPWVILEIHWSQLIWGYYWGWGCACCCSWMWGMRLSLFGSLSEHKALKVLSNGRGGGLWVVSIDRPYTPLHFRRFKKKILKDPGPLKNKNVFERINNFSWGVTESRGVRG